VPFVSRNHFRLPSSIVPTNVDGSVLDVVETYNDLGQMQTMTLKRGRF